MERKRFLELVDQKINQVRKTFLVKGTHDNNEPEHLILFILDTIRTGQFDGIISLKIKETKIYDPILNEQKVKLQRTYSDF
jgi:hypothetical protein